MIRKALISSCLLYANLIGFEIDKNNIDSSKQGIILGTFFAKEKAQRAVRSYPQFDTYIKEVKTAGLPYYVVFALNINNDEHNLVFELIKRKADDAFKVSNDVVKELALKNSTFSDSINKKSLKPNKIEKTDKNLSSNPEIEIDINKKAIALGAFNTKNQALKIKDKFPQDWIYVKKVDGKNGIYFVPYSVNIPKQDLKENLNRIKKTIPTAYTCSDKRVKELADIYNSSGKKIVAKAQKSKVFPESKFDETSTKANTLSIDTNLPDEEDFYRELFADDQYLDETKDKKTKIEISKKAIALGAFITKEKALSVKNKFPQDRIFVKKLVGSRGVYFVPYSVNIPKEKLDENLQRIRRVIPTAYTCSDKRVKELADIYNGAKRTIIEKEKKTNLSIESKLDKPHQKANPISINTDLPNKDFYKDLFADDYYLHNMDSQESKRKKIDPASEKRFNSGYIEENIDINKKAVALGAFITKKQALSIKEKFPQDQVYVKRVVGSRGVYFVPYSVNIPKEELDENLQRIRRVIPTAYICSDKRVKELAKIYNSPKAKENGYPALKKPGNLPVPVLNKPVPNKKIDSKEADALSMEKSKLKSFIDLNKRSLTIAKVPSLNEAENIAGDLYMYDVFIKPPLIKGKSYTVYLINIEKGKIKKTKDDLLKKYSGVYETSRTRLSYFFRKKRKDDIYIAKNTNIPLKKKNIIVRGLERKQNSFQTEFDEAKSLFREKEYKKALGKLLMLSKNNTENKNLNFFIGRSYYELGEYELSSSYFERIAIKDEKNLRAKLELAQSYLMLDLYDEAIENFNSVLQGDIPKNVKENIQNRLEQIEEKRKKHFAWGKFGINISYDNNSYNVSDTKTFNTLNFDGLTVTDERYSEISKAVTLNLNHLYKISNSTGVKNSFAVMKKYFDKDDQRLADDMATGIAKEEKKETELFSYGLSFMKTSDKDMLSTGVDLSKTKAGGKDYLRTKGLNLSYQRVLYRKIKSMMALKIYNKSYRQNDDKNLDSNNFQFMFGQMLPSDEWGRFNLVYIYNKEKRTSPLENGFDQRTSDKDTNTLYLSNFYELSDSFSVQTGLVYSFSQNKEEDNNFDIFGVKKEDELRSVFAQLQYALNKNTVLTTGLKYYENRSNIDIYSYDKLIFDFGFIYNF